MHRKRNSLTVCMVLIGLNLLFIFGNSALPAESSGRLSQWVGEVLSKLFPFLSGDRPEGGHLLRKLAHFSEFACLGCLISWLARLLHLTKREQWLLPLLLGLGAACVDETIQIFVSGRASSLLDVWIDFGGVTAGIMLLRLGQTVRKHYFIKQKLEDTP